MTAPKRAVFSFVGRCLENILREPVGQREQMPQDLFHSMSPEALRREIDKIVGEDPRSLPRGSKVFAAVAKLQGFDAFPDIVDDHQLELMIQGGAVELQRGLSGSHGVPAQLYARDLARGTLYPGTLAAFGSGIYLSTPGMVAQSPVPGFPRLSLTALRYGSQGETGIIVRGALKKTANLLVNGDVKELMRENKNRAKKAGVADFGTFAASLGFDGFQCEKMDADDHEMWYVVVNRAVLVFQKTALRRLNK